MYAKVFKDSAGARKAWETRKRNAAAAGNAMVAQALGAPKPATLTPPKDPGYSVTPARYSKGNFAVRAPSTDGFKTRAARLLEHLNGKYTHREKAYIISPTKLEKFKKLFADGKDASVITGKLHD